MPLSILVCHRKPFSNLFFLCLLNPVIWLVGWLVGRFGFLLSNYILNNIWVMLSKKLCSHFPSKWQAHKNAVLAVYQGWSRKVVNGLSAALLSPSLPPHKLHSDFVIENAAKLLDTENTRDTENTNALVHLCPPSCLKPHSLCLHKSLLTWCC